MAPSIVVFEDGGPVGIEGADSSGRISWHSSQSSAFGHTLKRMNLTSNLRQLGGDLSLIVTVREAPPGELQEDDEYFSPIARHPMFQYRPLTDTTRVPHEKAVRIMASCV